MISVTGTPRLLNDAEAADLLRLPLARFKRLATAGLVPRVILPGGEVRFDEHDLREWLNGLKLPAEAASV